MKRKHFIIALMAMLFSFSFTTSAQQLLVNCDYNSSTEGWGTTKFSNYAGAYAYATANSKTSATIVIEKTNTISGNTSVAKIGEQKYATLNEALEATKTMTGDVTVEIYDKVTFNQPLIGNYTSINFVGKEADAEMYLDVQGYTTATGKKVSFTDLKLSKSEGGFITNAGFMNVAFGIYDVEEVTYTNCTFENGACASSGKVTFNGCTFKKSWDKYGLWAYGNVDVTVQGSTFANYRGIKMYAENGADASVEKANLTVKNTNFSAVDNKPAIVLTYGESVVLEGNTYSSTGTFELDLDGKPNGVAVTSDVAPVCVNDNGACGVLVDGKIYTTVAQAAEVATETSTVTLLHSSDETVEFPMGTTIEKNGFTADNVTTAKPVAKIGETPYATLQAAIEAVQDGQTILLIADITVEEANATNGNAVYYTGDKSFTIDLNDKTVTGNTSNVVFRFQKAVGGAENTITIKNGKVVAKENTWSAISVGSNADTKTNIILTGLEIEACKRNDFAVRARSGAIFTITDCTITANAYGGGVAAGGGEVTMTDVTINQYGLDASAPWNSAAFGISSGGKMTINSGSYYATPKAAADGNNQGTSHGSFVGIIMNSGGTLIINGGTFTNDNFGDNALATAARGLIEADTGAVVEINGGIFNGLKSILAMTNNLGNANKNPSATIKGGTFSADPRVSGLYASNLIKIAEGYVVTEKDGVYTVAKAVAKIEEKGYASLQAAFNAVQDGETIKLVDNVTISAETAGYTDGTYTDGVRYTGDKSFTVNFNGKTVTDDGCVNDYLIYINNKGEKASEITFTNGTIVSANGCWSAVCVNSSAATQNVKLNLNRMNITNSNDAVYSGNPVVRVRTLATVNVNDGTIITSNGASYGVAANTDGSTVNINEGAKIVQQNSGTTGGNSVFAAVGGKGVINIKGGTITSDRYGVHTMTTGTPVINISGGTITAPVALKSSTNGGNGELATINVTGGTINGTLETYTDNGKIVVSGGTFSEAVAEEYCADGFVPAENADGTFGVEKAPVASINGTKYTSLAEAVAAALAGETITLVSDVTEDLTTTKKITIDGAGKTYTGAMTLKADATFKNVNFDGKGYNGYAITTRGAQYLTIDGGSAKNYGYGFVQLASATVLTTVKNVTVSNMNYGVKVDYSGAVVLDSVDITAGVAAVLNSNYGEKTITIKDSKLNILGTWERNNTVKTTYAFEGANTIGEFKTVDAIDNFKLAVAGTTLTAPAGKTVTTGVDGYSVKYEDGKYFLKGHVAKIGDKGYVTLAEAVEAAKAGNTITLLADITEDVTLSKAVTIDGAANTYTGAMTLKADATISNLNFDGKGYNGYAITTRGAHYVTIDGGSAKNYGFGFVQLASATTLTTVKNVTVSDMNYGVKVDYSNAVVLENVDITAAVAAVLNSNYGKKTITIRKSKLNILGTWVRNNTVKTTYAFEGENTVGEFITEDAIDNFKLAVAGTTLTAPEGKTVTTDVENSMVVYKDGAYEVIPAAAKIGATSYETHEEAFKAVKAGETLTLLADLSMSEILVLDKAITLDGNGKELTSTAARAINVSGADGVTIKNLTINASGERAINVIQNATNVTVDNVTATAANYTVNVAASAPNAVVAISNSNLTGLNVVNVASAGANVTIEGGKITCNDQNANENYAALALNKDAVGAKIAATSVEFDIKGDSKKAKNGAEDGEITIDGSTDGVAVNVAYIKSESDYYYAYTSIEAAIEAAKAGETIVLLRDVEANAVILLGKSLTINGNGHKVTSSANRVFRVTTGDVVVTMNDVNMVSTAFSNYTSDIRGISIDGPSSNVKLTLNNCSVDFDPESGSDWAYAVNMSGGCEGHTLTINGGTYEGANVINIWGNNHKITIDGATLNSLYNAPQNNYHGQCVRFEGTGCETTIKNSVFNGVHAVVVGEMTPDANTVAQENNTDNTKTYAVKAGTKYYYTLAEAFAAVEDNATIEVRRDIEETETAVNTKNVVLDLKGKTVTMVYNQKATKNHTMISNSGNLTIQSSVEGGKLSYTYAGENLGTTYSANTVTSNPGSVLTVKSGTIENLTFDSGIIAYAIDGLTNGGAGDVTVNIEGGVITSKRQALRIFANSTTNTGALNISGGDFTGRVIVQNASAKANKAALNITGGTFNANEYKTDVLYVGGSSSAEIEINATVSGGTFNGEITETNVAGFISGGTFANPVAAQYCAAGFMPNKNTDGTYGVVLAQDVVASIDGVTYVTLKAAVAAAKAGETITLLQDVKENVTISKHLTIDGANKIITGMITTDGKSLKVTIKNVNFNGNNKAIYYAVKADDDLNLVVENCSVDSYSYGFLYANKSNDKIVVKDVTVENCASYGAYLVSFNSATFENFTVSGAQYGVAVSNAGARKVSFMNVSFDVTGTPLHINEQGTGNITFNFSGVNDMGMAEYYTSQYVKVVAAAQVGTKVCGSLQDAVVAANDGETVKVLGDLNMTSANFVTQVDGYATLVNVAGKAVTIDLNGKTVTVNAAHADLNGKAKGNMLMSVFHADPNGTLTLTDNSAEGTGTVELYANDATVYGLIVSENAYDKSNPGKIIVNGGNYIADKVSDSMIFADINEVITVNGGNFQLDNVGTGANGKPWIFNTYGNNQIHINVNGGTYNANVAEQYWSYEVNLGSGLTTRPNGDGTWSVVTGITLVDGKFTEYTNNETKVVEYISYTRNNIPTTWTSIYLPFKVPVSVLADQGFEVAYINGVRRDDKNDDGILDEFAMETIYIHGGDNCDGRNKTLKANYPYFIRTKGSERKNLEITLEDWILYAAENATYDCTTMTEKYEITGNSSQMSIVNKYGISGGGWTYLNSAQTLKPFRFYMSITSRDNSEPVIITSPMRIVVRGHENEDGTTTIYDVVGTKQNSDVIYDIHGRRVLDPQKGNLYIINGKKVVY